LPMPLCSCHCTLIVLSFASYCEASIGFCYIIGFFLLFKLFAFSSSKCAFEVCDIFVLLPQYFLSLYAPPQC
jgi:hypothetical protein